MLLAELFESTDRIWFHGTSDKLIKPGEKFIQPGVDGAVWLTSDKAKAERFAKSTAARAGGSPIILVVDDKDTLQDPANFGDDYVRSVSGPVKIKNINSCKSR